MIDQNDIKIEDIPLDFKEIAEKIGLNSLLELFKMRGGEELYITSMKTVKRTARNRMIRAEFDGRNYRKLARKYSLSTVYIRELLKVPTSRN